MKFLPDVTEEIPIQNVFNQYMNVK